MKISLSMTQEQLEAAQKHLFPGDGKEAAAIFLCGRRNGAENHRLLVQQIVPIPYAICTQRTEQAVSWPTNFIVPYVEKAAREQLAIVKIHSHPSDYRDFSNTDDRADKMLFPSIYGWTESALPHGSAIMLPEGRIFGRAVHKNGRLQSFNKVCVIGDKITFWRPASGDTKRPSEFLVKNMQAFGEATYHMMSGLTVAVIGCSGTGSIVIEQLMRLGVGHIIIIDPDDIEPKNLNRIINSTKADLGKSKVDVFEKMIERTGLGTTVTTLKTHVGDPQAIRAIGEADIIFGCVDSIDGRYLLNRIATFYMQPYFDVGVKLEADGKGGVTQVCGNVHYLRPGKSSLRTRGVFGEEELRASMLKRFAPATYEQLLESKYIKGAEENRPAVIALNMNIASLAVMDFMARLHNFRHDPEHCARIAVSHSAGFMRFFSEDEAGKRDDILYGLLGQGDTEPVLKLSALQAEGTGA